MTVLSLLNPFGWLGWGGPAKLSGGNQPSGADPVSYSGKSVTPERALELAAYWACVKLIAQTIGTLSCRLYTQAADGTRTAAVANPLYDLLLHQPNADHSAVEFWEGVGGCLGIWGNSFALKSIIGGRLVALELLRPWHMQVLRDVDGTPVYRYNDPIHGLQTYGPDDLFVVRGFGLCDLTGFAPIQFARQTLGAAIAADEAAGSVFRNGMRMSGWFKYTGGLGASKGILNGEQQDQMRAALIKPYVGSENTGKVGLLPGDVDWLATAMNPVDAELLNNRRMNVEEICRFFGVPPILVGHSAQGQTMWGTGVDSIVLGWMTTGLRPYLKRIEAAIARDIIGRSDRQSLIVAFDTSELTRGDNKGQSEIDQSQANTGIKTRNEIRRERNLPPMPGGDTLTVQSALLPIEMLGKVAQLPADKPVDGGADITQAEAKRLVSMIDAALKYSDNQPRDAHGRWSGTGRGGAYTAKDTTRIITDIGAGIAGLTALGWLATKPVVADPVDGVITTHQSHIEAAQFIGRVIKNVIVPESLDTHRKYFDAERQHFQQTVGADRVAAAKRAITAIRFTASKIVHDSTMVAIGHLADHMAVRAGQAAGLSPRQVKPYDSDAVSRVASALINGAFRTSRSYKASADQPDPAVVGALAFPLARICLEYVMSGISSLLDDAELHPVVHDAADAMSAELASQGKAFDPSESRDDHGEWTSGGGGASGGNSQDWDAAKREAMLVVKGTAIVAGAALAVFFAPEIAGAAAAVTGSEAIGAGAAAAIPWIAKQSGTIADGFFGSAVYQAGLSIAKNRGYDTSKVEQMLRPYTEPFGVYGKSAVTKDIDVPRLRKTLAVVVDSACGELLASADRRAPKTIDDAHVKAVKGSVRQVRDKFKARLLSGDAS